MPEGKYDKFTLFDTVVNVVTNASKMQATDAYHFCAGYFCTHVGVTNKQVKRCGKVITQRIGGAWAITQPPAIRLLDLRGSAKRDPCL